MKKKPENFRKIFDHSNDAIFVIDPPNDKILEVNPKACRMLGYSRKELLSMKVSDVHPNEMPKLLEFAKSVATIGHGFTDQLTCLTKEGNFLSAEISASTIDLNGINCIIAMVRDITQRKWMEKVLRESELLQHLTAGTASVTGDDFFRSLVRHLASALDVRYAFVTQCTDATLTRVKTLAFWVGEDFGDNVEYALADTPCENVIGGSTCYYPKNLMTLFPKDEGLVELNAESFLGIPINDSRGNVLGHIAVFDDRQMDDEPRGMSILQIFASRAGAELDRKRTEEALRDSLSQLSKKNRYETIVSSITQSVHQSINFEEVLDNAVESMSKNIDKVDQVAIYLVEGKEAAIRSYKGFTADFIEKAGRIAYPNGFIWKTIIEGKPRYVQDVDEDDIIGPAGREMGIKSYLSMPVYYEGKTIGAIGLNSFQKNAFDHEELSLLETIREQIGIAIDNAKQAEALKKALLVVERLKDRLQAENVYLQEEIKSEYNFEEIVGQSEALQNVLQKVEQVAPTETSVLIHGETGTGKELIARAIHSLSERRNRPLVKVNCAAISAGLVESELFGHEKGAFTGAVQQRAGRFELADGGTIFLDEVGDLPPDTQVKLLRVLQEGEFERVGSSKSIKVDLRIVAATNRDLVQAVNEGTFRSDLFFRLSVFPIKVPPLRERKSDIPLLVKFLIAKFAKRLGKKVEGISKDALDLLVDYSWPGNIRELQNVIERAVVLAEDPILRIDESMILRLDTRPGADSANSDSKRLEDIERLHIISVLEQTDWVIEGTYGAASILGLNPSTLRSRMRKMGIKKPG